MIAVVLHKQVGSCEDDEIVDKRPPVELSLHPRHHDRLHLPYRLRIVLEPERLMLVMDQALPAPDGEANLLPERDRMVMVLMLPVLYLLAGLK